jgi:hypothetical protein
LGLHRPPNFSGGTSSDCLLVTGEAREQVGTIGCDESATVFRAQPALDGDRTQRTPETGILRIPRELVRVEICQVIGVRAPDVDDRDGAIEPIQHSEGFLQSISRSLVANWNAHKELEVLGGHR